MNETAVELDYGCKIVLQEWDTFPPSAELEYIEHSPDPWYGNSTTYVCIDKEQARAIIELLTKFVNEENENE